MYMKGSVTDLLDDFEEAAELVPVSLGIRFANFTLDIIGFFLAVIIIFIIVDLLGIEEGALATGNYFLDRFFIPTIAWVIFFTVWEGAGKGRTPGKFMTGTVAVRNDGAPFTFRDALLRSLCRAIPFEPLTVLGGNLLHDNATNTTVVKRRK